EITALGVHEIRVLDRTFNQDEERAIAILSLIQREFPDLHLHLEVDPALGGPRWFDALAQFPPGRLHLEAGIQTFAPAALQQIGRESRTDSVEEGLKSHVALSRVALHVDLIAGLPAQTFQDVLNDVHTLVAYGPEEIQLELLKVLPGTPLRQLLPSALKWSSSPPYAVFESPTFSQKEVALACVLSTLLDELYNHSHLQPLFRWTLAHWPNALLTLIQEKAGENEPTRRTDLPERFKRLKRALESQPTRPGDEAVRFAWLAAGLSPKEYGIQPRRQAPAPFQGRILRSGRAMKGARSFTASFTTNIGEQLLLEESKRDGGAYRYHFEIRCRGEVGRITSDNGAQAVTVNDRPKSPPRGPR
ncbi:MAG: radical SAM protein, partial [Planctomycetota bacterium]